MANENAPESKPVKSPETKPATPPETKAPPLKKPSFGASAIGPDAAGTPKPETAKEKAKGDNGPPAPDYEAAAKDARKIGNMSEEVQSDYLRSLFGMMKPLGIGIRRDLVDIAEGASLSIPFKDAPESELEG